MSALLANNREFLKSGNLTRLWLGPQAAPAADLNTESDTPESSPTAVEARAIAPTAPRIGETLHRPVLRPGGQGSDSRRPRGTVRGAGRPVRPPGGQGLVLAAGRSLLRPVRPALGPAADRAGRDLPADRALGMVANDEAATLLKLLALGDEAIAAGRTRPARAVLERLKGRAGRIGAGDFGRAALSKKACSGLLKIKFSHLGRQNRCWKNPIFARRKPRKTAANVGFL